MPDITMCTNMLCKKRHNCYRYTAIPNEHWQSYTSFNEKDCTDFIEKYDLGTRTVKEVMAKEKMKDGKVRAKE